MQVDRTASGMPFAGSVRGLGVCDVLRVELVSAQRAGLKTELATRVAALESERGGPAFDLDQDDEQATTREELRVLARLRESIPPFPVERFAFTGPAGIVLELVGACLAAAVTRADARLGEGEPGTSWASACGDELEAAAAWITTALDCRAVEGYCFEPDVDPPTRGDVSPRHPTRSYTAMNPPGGASCPCVPTAS